MRKEIYKMLCERLGNIPEIKYIPQFGIRNSA